MPIIVVVLALALVAISANYADSGNTNGPTLAGATTSIGTDLVIIAVVTAGIYAVHKFA